MNNESKNALFEQAVREWMTLIDARLSNLRVPIPDRILLAAHEFVDVCILDIDGFVHRAITRWYRQELARNISSHLMASAERMTEVRQPAFGLACWESHQAVEKALKLLGRQYRGKHKKRQCQ